jgi:hypothetical protein
MKVLKPGFFVMTIIGCAIVAAGCAIADYKQLAYIIGMTARVAVVIAIVGVCILMCIPQPGSGQGRRNKFLQLILLSFITISNYECSSVSPVSSPIPVSDNIAGSFDIQPGFIIVSMDTVQYNQSTKQWTIPHPCDEIYFGPGRDVWINGTEWEVKIFYGTNSTVITDPCRWLSGMKFKLVLLN